eukprot:CAMPEP_0178999520 /NCGR_PEP_ID=MMETSP0795-20121207/10113_1 /TAXON_ID=88552 /ORGANISM="Amoebophrya sp., Strain Ameob2" /LENGTH=313 /DNA_ID=CAMNT_0020692317 /DNA_START=350 /DNA_END=1291 /DNA_ORIENTATION=+
MYDLYFLYVAHSTDLGIAVSCGVLLHGFVGLALWAYFRTLLSEPGFVSEEWQIQAMEEDLGTLCRKCQAKRPVRAHHCGTTGKCVRRMDHYCPWTGNTIGFENHRFFIQFLGYTTLVCSMLFFSALPDLIQLLGDRRKWPGTAKFTAFAGGSEEGANVHLTLCAVALLIALSFGLSVFGLWVTHLYLLFTNKTTLETGGMFGTPEQYDMGVGQNIEQLCGKFGSAWFLPVAAKGRTVDGYSYPRNKDAGSGAEEDSGDEGEGRDSGARERRSSRSYRKVNDGLSPHKASSSSPLGAAAPGEHDDPDADLLLDK